MYFRNVALIFLIFFVLSTPFVLADTFTVSVASGTNLINASNQSAVTVTGHISGFTAGAVVVTLTDSASSTAEASEDLVGLNSGSYSIAVDASALIDGQVTVSVTATPTGGSALQATPVVVTKKSVTTDPDIVFYLLPSGSVASDCTDHPENFLPYDANVPTKTGVCALLSTTSAEVATAVANDMPHFFTENGTYGPFAFKDAFGNTGSASTTVANIDTTSPVITITAPASATTTGQAITPSVSATDVNIVTLACSLDGSALLDCVSQQGGLVSGAHLFTVEATDVVGNATSTSLSFTVSSTYPLLNLVASSSPLFVELVDQSATTTFDVVSGIGTSSVMVPVGTSISRTDGSAIIPANISMTALDGSTFSNIATNAVVNGALEWGVLGQGVTFSKTITIKVYVGSSADGNTLDIHQSNALDSGWGTNGLIKTTCVVASGLCTFEATSSSYIAITHTVTPVVTNTGGGGGGGGGGGLITNPPVIASPSILTPPVTAPTVTTDISGGQVLGASTYNFTKTLALGSLGDDVKALQERLQDEGIYIGPITSYFGVLTQTALKTYQTKRGIEAVGILGPITRAELNKGLLESVPVAVHIQTLSDAQISAILSLLASFGADQKVIADVSVALGKTLP